MGRNYPLGYTGPQIDALLEKIDELGEATTEEAGLMSTADKSKLNDIAPGAQANVIEQVEVGGNTLEPVNKKVTIPVDSAPASGSNNPVSSGAVFTGLGNINAKIPSEASAQNQLADKTYVNDAVSTASATFRGTFNLVSDLNLSVSATQAQTVTALNSAVATKDNNDYAFVQVPTADATPTEIARIDRYKYNGTTFAFEYSINNSGFTAEQWAALNSGINSAMVTKLGNLPTASELATALLGKVDKVEGKGLSTNDYSDEEKAKVAGSADKVSGAIEGHIAALDSEGNIKDSGVSVSDIRNAMVSEGIADTMSAGTAQEFVFRQSGGDGVNYMKRIKGKTLVWNQLYDSSAPTAISGHKYLVSEKISGTVSASIGTIISYISGSTERMCIDLTLMFGAGNEPSTVAEFESMFPLPYYEYNAGTLISNDAESIETVGFNQWDEEWENGDINTSTGEKTPGNTQIRSKNYISVLPNTSYYIKTCGYNASVCFYDSDKNFISGTPYKDTTFTTPSNCAFVLFGEYPGYGASYLHDICINLSDASKNGTYEPYWKRTLQLNLGSFQVRDSQGNVTTITGGLKSAGDVKDEIVGNKYIKRVGSVDLGELEWTLNTTNNVWLTNQAGRVPVKANDTAKTNQTAQFYVNVQAERQYLVVGTIGTNAWATSCNNGSTTTKPSGICYYELAAPVEYELVEPMANAVMVDSLGTGKAVFPEHEDGSPSAPFCCDSNYSISIKNLVAFINAQKNG